VINTGNTRDTRYIYNLENFSYFTRGTTPNAYGGWRVIEVNVPVYVRGHIRHFVAVNPGDFVFGDDDGLQIIPEPYVDEVLLKGEEIFAFEEKEREAIRKELTLDQVYEMYGEL
jgi:regulator of RNase E activity RraA